MTQEEQSAKAKPTSEAAPTQIHSDNLELSVYSCWTGKRILRTKLVDMKVDPKGKFVSIDIDDDESAKPEFTLEASAPPAAERTALARIQERLLDQDHFSEVCDKGKLVYHKEFVDRIIKEEIEAPKSDNAPAIGKEEAIQAPAKPMTPSTTDSETTAQAIWENDAFQDGLEMIRNGLKEEQFTAYTTILQAIKTEIEGKSANFR